MKLDSSTRIVVTGASGMLAGDLLPLLLDRHCELILGDKNAKEVHGCPVTELDILDSRAVGQLISEFKPHWVINCAAFTAVDDAETKSDLAFAINGAGPGILAKAVREQNGRLLHLSTDYVFGATVPYGEVGTPFRETDEPRPCGVYGKSKRQGEVELSKVLPDRFLLVRTSWLHGVYGPNFINTMLRIAGERTELKVVNDQRGSPTWAGWLSHVLVRLIERDASGVFHASCRGDITWFDFAREIFAQAGKSVQVLPQTTQELARPAPRPAYSTFDLTKLSNFLGELCMSYQEGIAQHLKAMKQVV